MNPEPDNLSSYEELIKYGKKIVEAGLVHSHFGNISKRVGDLMLISASGSMLDELEGQIVTVPVYPDSAPQRGELEFELELEPGLTPSTEVNVHRAIYNATSTLAILHAHSKYAVVISILYHQGEQRQKEKKKQKQIELMMPGDSESIYSLHEIPVPVVYGDAGSEELARNAANALRDHNGIIVHGHGTFARGATVSEAFATLCSIEHACTVKYLVENVKNTSPNL